ncbi:MAG: hypothetical protein LBU85_12700 [Treponema sp.]|jgi:hypothetical protein|nr:hypothetical protein [Treponema sp.]
MELLWFWEKLKLRLFGSPFDDLLIKEAMKKLQMEGNRPCKEVAKRAIELYRKTKDEKYNNEAVMILLRFRVVMTDYCFEKLLKELRVTKESAIKAMASALNFTLAKKGETAWLNVKM